MLLGSEGEQVGSKQELLFLLFIHPIIQRLSASCQAPCQVLGCRDE